MLIVKFTCNLTIDVNALFNYLNPIIKEVTFLTMIERKFLISILIGLCVDVTKDKTAT